VKLLRSMLAGRNGPSAFRRGLAFARSLRRSVTTGANLSTVYFAPLAATGSEGRTILSLFPDADLITGRQATKAALKRLESPLLLHLATHGFFLDDAPISQERGTRAISARANIKNPLLRSGLALAGPT
jgi:hypothetical protein